LATKKKQKKSATQNPQGKKGKKKNTKRQSNGHFCWVCGEHKANEKFSGRGHATHMCKQCHALPVEERNEMVAVRKAENMAFRYLSEQEINWLRKKMNDPRPDVREAARAAHNFKFPRFERNQIKKGLTARSLEFYINAEVWNEYGDEIPVHMRFFMDSSGVIRRIDYNMPIGEQETELNIKQPDALKFLKAVVHQLDAPFWSEDLSDTGDHDYDPYDSYEDVGEDNNDETIDNEQEQLFEEREPICSLRMLLTKGLGENVQTFYNQLHEAPQDLFWSLMEWFEPDDEEELDFDHDYPDKNEDN
jgi:hypothetical protein